MPMNCEDIKKIAIEAGASLVGIGDLSAFERPYPSMKKALVVAVRLSDAIFDEVAAGETPTHEYFHQYRTTNAYIDQLLYTVGLKLQDQGFRVVQVAASQSISKNGNGYQALFSHRAAAVQGGLGWIGKNNSLVTKAYGPRVRLGTLFFEEPDGLEIVTDLPMKETFCGTCNQCVKICPAYALSGITWTAETSREAIIDVRACSEHMHSAYQHIGRGVVCGLCISICPVGKQRNR